MRPRDAPADDENNLLLRVPLLSSSQQCDGWRDARLGKPHAIDLEYRPVEHATPILEC